MNFINIKLFKIKFYILLSNFLIIYYFIQFVYYIIIKFNTCVININLFIFLTPFLLLFNLIQNSNIYYLLFLSVFL